MCNKKKYTEAKDAKIPKWALGSWTLGCVYTAYKAKGILYAAKTFFNVSFIESIRWLYNHSSWFNKFLRKRARKLHPMQEILLDVLFTNKPIDVDKVCNDIRSVI